VSVAGMGKRGIVPYGSSTYFELNNIACDAQPWQIGPHIQIAQCQSFVLGQMELQLLNTHAAGSRKLYKSSYSTLETNLMCLLIEGCRNFNISQLNGEANSTLLRMYQCSNFKSGPISNQENGPLGIGETMVDLRDCVNYSIDGFHASGFERLYKVTAADGGLLQEFFANNGTFVRAPALHDGLTAMGTINADSVLFQAHKHVSGQTATMDPRQFRLGCGDNSNYAFTLGSFETGNPDERNHIYIQMPGGPPAGHSAGQMPLYFTIAFDWQGLGGVHCGRYLNVGPSGGSGAAWPGIFQVNNEQVMTTRQPAVADATDAATAITQLNLLLARLRTHGMIAP
jgi:hypothetical protein